MLSAAAIISTDAQAVDCSKHKIYCAITQLQPSVDSGWAMELSNFIYRYSKINNTDPLRSVAIMMKESSIRNIHRKVTGLMFEEECDKFNACKTVVKEATVMTDFGPFQFSYGTIKAYKIDPIRVETDLEYAVKWHFNILKQKQVLCSDYGQEAWSCYHSKTPHLRKSYLNQVNKIYDRIKPSPKKTDVNNSSNVHYTK